MSWSIKQQLVQLLVLYTSKLEHRAYSYLDNGFITVFCLLIKYFLLVNLVTKFVSVGDKCVTIYIVGRSSYFSYW